MDETDKGALRDKVAAPDPAAVSADADSEASGFPDRAAHDAADAEQARPARAAVPRLDADRAVSTHDYPEAAPRRLRHVNLIIAATVIILLIAVGGTVFALTG